MLETETIEEVEEETHIPELIQALSLSLIGVEFEEFVNMDDQLADCDMECTGATPTDEQRNEEDDEEEETENGPIPTLAESIQAAEVLARFTKFRGMTEEYEMVSNVQRKIIQEGRAQRKQKITDFFRHHCHAN